MNLRPYQRKLAAEVLADLKRGTAEVLLAACPGFGKTEVALYLIGRLLALGLVKRILVLAHGTTVLRSNFLDRLKARRPDLLPVVDVALPQEWRRLRDVEYPLVIVDEAHQFYEAGEGGLVDRVLKQVKAKQRLLLTGSPGRFIRRGLKPHAFALDELFKVDGGKWVSDIRVDLALSAYEIRERDWNQTGEVRDRVRYKQRQTDKTLDRLMTSLGPRLKLGRSPTLIACKGIKMADQVAAFFKRRGIKCAVSHSGPNGDKDSAAVEAFKGGKVKLLVVVARATLGFDYPAMRNFIDLTGSRNPDRIFQMMCRLARPTEGKPEKIYVKVMPEAFSGKDLRLFMTGVCALKYRELYTTWDGGSFYKLRVPVGRSGEPRPEGENGSAERKRPAFESAMMLFGDGFEEARDASGRLATVRLGRIVGHGPDPTGNKLAILDFHRDNGRWPSNRRGCTPTERRLALLLQSYTRPPHLDSEFECELRLSGWPNPIEDRVLGFIWSGSRLPSMESDNLHERGLARHFLRLMASSEAFRLRLTKLVAVEGLKHLHHDIKARQLVIVSEAPFPPVPPAPAPASPGRPSP